MKKNSISLAIKLGRSKDAPVLQPDAFSKCKTAFSALAYSAITAALLACGGGGSTTTPMPTSSKITLGGTAIKGPMANAKISVYKTTADGKQGDLLNTVVSDANGNYSVAVDGYSGVVLVVASVVPGTTMYDEATAGTITPVAGFQMRASFAVVSGQSYSAQINPFTDLAVTSALATAGALTPVNVAQANKDMAEILSFDPLTTEATFDTTSKKAPTNAAAAALTALSKMAQTGELSCITGDQAAKVACITQELSKKGTQDPTVKAALQSTIDVVVNTANLPVLKIMVPSGTPVTQATELEQTKAFMGTLRSNAKALNATDFSLQTELQAVANDLKGRTAPIASINMDVINITRKGVQLWNDVILAQTATFVVGKNFYDGSAFIGSCIFFSDADLLVRATSKTDALYVGCGTASKYVPAINANGEYKPCTAIDELCYSYWNMRIRLQADANDTTKFTVHTRTREDAYTAKAIIWSYYTFATTTSPTSLTTSLPVATSSMPIYATGTTCPADAFGCYSYVTYNPAKQIPHGAAFPGYAASLVAVRDANGLVTSVAIAGELAPPFTVSNASGYYDFALMKYVYKPSVATLLGDKQNIALSAAFTTNAGLDKLSVSGFMELIKNAALETRIELLEGSYLQAKPDGLGSYSAKDGSQEMLLKLKGGSLGSTISGDLKMSSFKADKSGTSYIPTLISFNGAVQRNNTTFFNGALTVEALNYDAFDAVVLKSVTNFLTARVGFVGKVTIPTRPVLNVSLSATHKDTGSNATSSTAVTGQYAQGSITINVNGTGNATSNNISLESTEGIKLVMDKAQTIYPLTKGSDLMGEYSTVTRRLTYSDSSYEQY